MNTNQDYNSWINLGHIYSQEMDVILFTENRFGKGKYGFCDQALDGIELLMQSLYIRDVNQMDEKGEYKDFQSAILYLAFMHIHRIVHIFIAVYNLFLRGYYSESAILLRSIVESFVRLKYVNKNGKIEDINKILLNFGKPKKERYNVHISTMFKSISPEIYTLYTILCDFAHGGLFSHLPKIPKYPKYYGNMTLGVKYHEEAAGLIINQYSIYLLSHLEYLVKIFPGFKTRMPEPYSVKYYKLLSILWEVVNHMSDVNESDLLLKAAISLIEY